MHIKRKFIQLITATKQHTFTHYISYIFKLSLHLKEVSCLITTETNTTTNTFLFDFRFGTVIEFTYGLVIVKSMNSLFCSFNLEQRSAK